jgi:hypothetical protein
MNQKGFTFIELLVILSILLIFCSLLLIPFIKWSSTGSGKHTGFITAVEQRGYVFPNYVVYVKTDNSSSQEDQYCVNRNNSTLADQLKEFSKKRQLVSISYHGVRGIGLGLCEGEEITDVALDK